MDQYLLIILLIGISSLGMVFIPSLAKKLRISYALIYVGIGALLYTLFKNELPSPMPDLNKKLTLHLTELIVIISLMATGIKIDRPFSLKKWAIPLKLITIAMTICIGLGFILGYTFLNFALPSALLLGAVLAPTDPVLAEDVQVGPPHEKIKSETKFSLTSEAGLNDGLAFPFVWLAIIFCLIAQQKPASLINWFTYHLLYKVAIGITIGFITGKAVGYLIFKLSAKYKALIPKDGLLAISVMFCVYAIAELLHAYGFIAVFVCAISLRHAHKEHKFHLELHDFTNQIERLMLGVLLLFFGGALVCGILAPISFRMIAFSFIFLLIVRPLAAYLSLIGSKIHFKEKLAICFFGIRGMGSIFYLSFAFMQVNFNHQKELWATVAFTILVSITIHGLTASSIMSHLKVNIPKEKIPQ